MTGGEVDHFVIAPIAADGEESAVKWVFRPKPIEMQNARASNLLNVLPKKAIMDSPRVLVTWTITIDEAQARMVPKKPEECTSGQGPGGASRVTVQYSAMLSMVTH